MNRIKDKNTALTPAKIFAVLCPVVYFASYLTRKDYSVVLEAVIESEQISSSVAGLAESMSTIAYGAGQVISGFLGDKIKPQKMIGIGLFATAVLNVIMALCPSPGARTVIWMLNGLAQSMLWPPMVRLLASVMDKKGYDSACVNTNIAGISGTILLYLMSSLIWIRYFNWKYTFMCSAVMCAVILIMWIVGCRKADANMSTVVSADKSTEKAEKEYAKLSAKTLFSSGFVLIALAIILQGALRDGITNWIPSFICSTFNIGSAGAILKSVMIPILGVIALKIIGIINNKFIKEEARGAFYFFLICLVCCAFLVFFYSSNQYVTLIVSALAVAAMNGVNLYLVCIVPVRFEKYGKTATMSGIINALTYVGSAAATYGFGAVSESFGWNAVVVTWAVIAVLGTVCCLFSIRPWRRFAR